MPAEENRHEPYCNETNFDPRRHRQDRPSPRRAADGAGPAGTDRLALGHVTHELPAEFVWLLNELFTDVLDGRNESLTDGAERVLGRAPKDFSAYATETASTGIWSN